MSGNALDPAIGTGLCWVSKNELGVCVDGIIRAIIKVLSYEELSPTTSSSDDEDAGGNAKDDTWCEV